MKTKQATAKYKCYDDAFKHSAVEHWLFSGQTHDRAGAEVSVFAAIL